MALVLYKDHSKNSFYQFPNDILTYERNPHPSIEEMICISKNLNVPYINVFNRFSELRLKNGEKCSKDDPCIRVFQFLHCSETFDKVVGNVELKCMHEEFEFVGRIDHLPIESLHLIMQQVLLSESTIIKQFDKWKRSFIIQSHLEKPATRKKYELIDVDFDEETFEELRFPDIVLYKGFSESKEKLEEKLKITERKEDEEASDEKILALLDSSPNQFPLDLEIFNRNRHPTIQRMINISIETNTSYETVLKRFFELRMVVREKCETNDQCRMIYQYLNGKENVLLDKNSEKLLEKEFSETKNLREDQITGHFHLIMDKICLPSHVVRKKYSEWYEKRKLRNKLNKTLHRQFLKSEFDKKEVLSRGRSIELGRKCGLKPATVHRFFSIQECIKREKKRKERLSPDETH